MTISEITAKSILRKHKRIDSWFVSRYGMNFYRGCTHNCVYCDGRAEGYYVKGEFGRDIEVKINAVELLKKELDPKRKRKPMRKGFIILGGGVSDSYHEVEKEYNLASKLLGIIDEYNFPVQILTKSTMVEKDIEKIKEIDRNSRAIISMSFSSTDEKISTIFEPGVPTPEKRLDTIKKFADAGITCGMFLMPVIPFITDSTEILEQSINSAKKAGVKFIIFSGMTLKEGRQKEYFYKHLEQHYPELIKRYDAIYKGNKYGGPSNEYYSVIGKRFFNLAKKHKIPIRIPSSCFSDIIDRNDTVSVILDQMDYLLKQRGKDSPYGFASYSISSIDTPLSDFPDLKTIKGVGSVTERIIKDILKTGTSDYYEKLMNYEL